MSVQNPTIPTPTQAKGIDSIILDLQTHLDTELSWLTNGMGRGYRLSKVRTDQTTVFLPEVYLGKQNISYNYFSATPDNDKQGQSLFFVGEGTMPDQQKGFYGWVEYPVSIIFSANLETIDSALLVTEDFTQHLIQDVREALIRDLVGKSYRLEIDSIIRDFEDVYAEFDVSNDRGIAHLPMTHFRLNCTVTFKEDCTGVSLDRCAAILQNLSSDEKLNCVLPTYDFSSTTTQNALTAGQVTDLTDWLCATPPPTAYQMDLDGTNQYIYTPLSAEYDFEYNDTFTMVIRTTVTALQTANIINKLSIGGNPRGYFFAMLSSGKLRLDFQHDGTTTWNSITTDNPVVVTGTKQTLGFTYDGSSNVSGMKIYVDGVNVPASKTAANSDTLGTNTIVSSITEIYLGINHNLLSAFDGQLDEFVVWNAELTSANMLTEHNRDIDDITTTPPAAANLKLRAPLGEYGEYAAVDWFLDEITDTITGLQSANMTVANRVLA